MVSIRKIAEFRANKWEKKTGHKLDKEARERFMKVQGLLSELQSYLKNKYK